MAFLSFVPAFAQTVEEYTRQASQLVEEYQWEEAARVLRAGLERHPQDPELLLQLGSLLVRRGQIQEGEALLQKALQIQPDHPKVLYSAAVAEARKGQFSSAIALFKEALRRSAGESDTHHRLAFALLAGGDEQAALEHARRAVELNPLDANYRRLWALLLDIQGKTDEAYQQLKIAYGLAPHDTDLLFQLSEKRRMTGDLFQALEYLELAVEQDPENPLYHHRLARIYKELGQEESADHERRRSEELQQAFNTYSQALHLSTRGKTEPAIRLLEHVVEQDPEFVTGAMLLANLYEKRGREDRSLELYLRILERQPRWTAARERGAWIQARRGWFDAALRLIGDLQTPNRTLIEAYRRLGLEDWAGALQHLREIESSHPLNVKLLQLISFCLQSMGRTEEALSYLAKAGELHPNDREVLQQVREIKLERALRLLSERKWRSALEIFEALMEEDVQAAYLMHIAYCHQQLGEVHRAIEAYRTALEIDPQAVWARINLASCLYLQRRYQEAADEWQQVLLVAENAETYLHLGLCYAHLGRYPTAEHAFQKALDFGNPSAQLLYNLGVARIQNQKPEAWQLIRRAASAGYRPAKELLAQIGTR